MQLENENVSKMSFISRVCAQKTHLDVWVPQVAQLLNRCGRMLSVRRQQGAKTIHLYTGPTYTGLLASSLVFGGLGFCSDKWDFFFCKIFLHCKKKRKEKSILQNPKILFSVKLHLFFFVPNKSLYGVLRSP